jgi:hypothetical protein
MMKSFVIMQVALIDTNTVPYSYNLLSKECRNLGL